MRELLNKVFGRLKVIQRAAANRSGSITWVCHCSCGNIKLVSSDHLTRKTNSVKSCGCVVKERIGIKHKQWSGYKDISGNWWYNHILRERKQTSRPKIPINITKEYAWKLFIKQKRKCALSGIPIIISNSSNNTASIDRIDSSKGYIKGNVQWVHKHVNFMKRTYSQEYFLSMCKMIAKNNP